MTDPHAVLSVGPIILTLLGGIAGNFLVGIVERLRRRRPFIDTTDIPDILLLVIIIIFLIYIIGTFFSILMFGNLSLGSESFFAVIGILFGILGSILSNFLVQIWDHHHESKVRDGRWLNRDGWAIVLLTSILAVYVIYLFALFLQYT